MVLVVVAPLIIGVLLIVKSKGRGPSYPACGGCGYDVSGTVGNAARCPECGKDFVVVGIVPPVGKRNRGMLLTGVAVLLIPLMCVGGGALVAFHVHLHRNAPGGEAQEGDALFLGLARDVAQSPGAAVGFLGRGRPTVVGFGGQLFGGLGQLVFWAGIGGAKRETTK